MQVFTDAFADCRMVMKKTTFNSMLWNAWVDLCREDAELQTDVEPAIGPSRKRRAERGGADIVKRVRDELQCDELVAQAHVAFDTHLRPLFVAGTIDIHRLGMATHYWPLAEQKVHSNAQLYPCLASVSGDIECAAPRRVMYQAPVAPSFVYWLVAVLVLHLPRHGTMR